MTVRNQHVAPRGDEWIVRKTGSWKATRRFDTQQEAIEAARDFARKQGSLVFIHGKDGRIRKRDCVGNPPR